MESEIKIEKLDPADKKSISKIAHWYFKEWDTPIDKTVHRLANLPGRDTIFHLVLKIENEVIATGGLYNDVNILNIHEKLIKFKPWVGLLYTQEEYRNKGLATMLLTQIERCAKEKDLKKIYLYTFTAESLYSSCGWEIIDRVMYKDHETAIMEKAL